MIKLLEILFEKMSGNRSAERSRIDEVKDKLAILLPTNNRGQYPFILREQLRTVFGDNAPWYVVQAAYDKLCDEGRAQPRLDFSKSILKRAYAT